MTSLADVFARSRLPASRHWARLIILLIVILLGWSFFAEFDEVAVAVGEVVPQGQVKTIQHLEGGIIKKIYVREGDVVSAGGPLIRLDVISTRTSRKELSLRLDGALLKDARLKGQSQGKKPVYDAEISKRRPEMLGHEIARHQAFQNEFNSTLAVFKERVNQRQLEVRQIRTKQKTLLNDHAIASEEFKMSVRLLKEGLTSKLDHLKQKREFEMLEGQLLEMDVALPRAKAGVAEAREQVNNQILKFRRMSSEERGKVEREIDQTREELAKAVDQVKRLEIRSPIDGIVKSLRFHTIDGVIRPGDAIMDIVPTGENLVIEARLSPTEVGYVRVGQPALVKISAYDFIRYGGLDGKVIDISPDSHTDSDGNTYFRLVIKTVKTYFGDQPNLLPISPGMQATVDVHTGKKKVIRYLLTPVLKLKYEAFRER